MTNKVLSVRIFELKSNIRRVVREVEGAALEMLCGETHLGFESLTLRQTKSLENIRFLRDLFIADKTEDKVFIILSVVE